MIAGREVGPDAIEGCVARIDEARPTSRKLSSTFRRSIWKASLPTFVVCLRMTACLPSIVDRDLDGLDFQLNQKCDSCVFSVHCLPESARQRRLELIGICPRTCRALRAAEVTTIDELARVAASPTAARDQADRGL